MKVFLINFSTPILYDVALNLCREGYSIAYWEGYKQGFRDITQKGARDFPETVFHRTEDGVRLIFPESVNAEGFPPIGADVIEKLSKYESRFFSVLERSVYFNLPFQEKKHIYYSYVRFWLGMLRRHKPDAVFWSTIPHSGFHYSLYVLLQEIVKDTRCVFLYPILTGDRIMPMGNIEEGGMGLSDALESSAAHDVAASDLSPDIREYYLRMVNPDADLTPPYVKQGVRRKAFLGVPSMKAVAKHFRNGSFGKAFLSYTGSLFRRVTLISVHEDVRGIYFKLLSYRWRGMNAEILREYKELQTEPDFTKKFIYVPLHYQPEASTSPLGGVFEDQLLMIETIAASVPDGWFIYVKEHPAQLSPYAAGLLPRFRYRGYFRSMAGWKNVRLVPIETPSLKLTDNARAVATVTGTAGLESIMRDNKPALVFGYPFYMHCDGVLRVLNISECKKAIAEVENGYKPDRRKVLSFFAALDKASYRAKDFRSRNYKEDPKLPRAEIVRNITRLFLGRAD
ncbi:capsular biosynthesis protein [bacterium]|nr:capsular biosynthesis protein [bacterium]